MTNEVIVKEEQTEQVSMLAIIEKAALSPDVDPDKMDKLLNVQMKMMDKQAEINFNKDMARLRKELKPVIKNRENQQTSSRYADLEAIKKQVDPLLVNHAFFDSYDYAYPEDGVIITTCILTHEEGHATRHNVRVKRDNVGIAGKTNKTDVHGDASAMKYGQRLSLCAALGINTSDDDDGNAAGTYPITEKQIEILQKLIDKTGMDKEKFVKEFCKVDFLKDLSQKDYKRAYYALVARRNKQLEESDGTDT